MSDVRGCSCEVYAVGVCVRDVANYLTCAH